MRNVFFFHSCRSLEASLTTYCRNGFPDARLLGTEGLNTSWLAWRGCLLVSVEGRTPFGSRTDSYPWSGGYLSVLGRNGGCA